MTDRPVLVDVDRTVLVDISEHVVGGTRIRRFRLALSASGVLVIVALLFSEEARALIMQLLEY